MSDYKKAHWMILVLFLRLLFTPEDVGKMDARACSRCDCAHSNIRATTQAPLGLDVELVDLPPPVFRNTPPPPPTPTSLADAPNTERHGQLRTDNSSRRTDERYLASCSPPCHARVGTDERAGLMVWRKKQRGSRECLSQPRTHTHTQAYTW
ncbi:hypothetical protein IWZ00DRAFT_279951 [Phyllosticta capitalensis]